MEGDRFRRVDSGKGEERVVRKWEFCTGEDGFRKIGTQLDLFFWCINKWCIFCQSWFSNMPTTYLYHRRK